jgi:hypothetical protein
LPRKPAPTRRRAAVGATVALLAALGAGSYFAFRGPSRGNPTPGTPPEPAPAALPAPPNANANTNAGNAKTGEADRGKNDAEKTAMEKKLADAERKLAEEKKLAEKRAAEPNPSTPAPQPVTPAPSTTPSEQPTAGNACLRVVVTDAGGQPFGPARLVVVEQASSTMPTVYNFRTGPNGVGQRCGLAAGRHFKISAFGLRGAMRGTAEITLSRGENVLSIRLNGMDDERPTQPLRPMPGGRRRPRMMRP